MAEPKPCLFCGNDDILHTVKMQLKGERFGGSAVCGKCKATGPLVSGEHFDETVEAAYEAWNQRAERTCHLELTSWDDSHGTQHDFLGCSDCGDFVSTTDQYGPDDGPFYCSKCGSSIDHSFITDYASGEVIWTVGDGDLGDLSDDKNWRGAKVVE